MKEGREGGREGGGDGEVYYIPRLTRMNHNCCWV